MSDFNLTSGVVHCPGNFFITFLFRCLPLRLTTFLTTLNHGFVIFYDTLRGFLCKHQMPSIPYKSSITATFKPLLFIDDLEDIKLQIITLRHIRRICPENRMIRRLCSEFHLAESLVCCLCRLFDCLCQKFLCHEMGAGTGCKIAGRPLPVLSLSC